jgi:hypothetical protein
VSNYVPDAFNHNQRGTEVSTYTDLYGGLSLACQRVEKLTLCPLRPQTGHQTRRIRGFLKLLEPDS